MASKQAISIKCEICQSRDLPVFIVGYLVPGRMTRVADTHEYLCND